MSFLDWLTDANNPSLPKSEYLYGARHICVLVAALLACVVLTLIFRKKSRKSINTLLYVLCGIFIFFEISTRIISLAFADAYTWQSVLKTLIPMHICSIMVWVVIVAILTKSKALYSFGTIGGLLATVAYLLYPAVGLNKTYMSFSCIYSTFTHMLGFVTCILFITLKVSEFKISKIWQPFVGFIIMFSWGALLNFVIFPGSDYMYMVNDPLELNLGGMPYQILYVIVLILYTCTFYLVPLIANKIKSKKSKKQAQ